MQREEQVILIMQIVQKQKKKNPKASELELLANAKTVCNLLVESEDLEQEVVEDALAIIFDTEKAMVERKRSEEARKKAEAEERERARKEKELEALRRRLSAASAPTYSSPDPCSGGYSSSRGGSC